MSERLSDAQELHIREYAMSWSADSMLRELLAEIDALRELLAQAQSHLTGAWCPACRQRKSDHQVLDSGALNCSSVPPQVKP